MSFSLRRLLFTFGFATCGIATAAYCYAYGLLYSPVLMVILALTAMACGGLLFPRFRTRVLFFSPFVAVFLFIGATVATQLPPIYYAEFNSLQSRISRLPDVEILSSWKHEDVTLEDCGFVLRIMDSLDLRINFYDGYPPWHQLFRRIDGIEIRCSHDQRKLISSERLAEAGLEVNTLPAAIACMPEIVELSKTIPSDATYAPNGYWLKVTYPVH